MVADYAQFRLVDAPRTTTVACRTGMITLTGRTPAIRVCTIFAGDRAGTNSRPAKVQYLLDNGVITAAGRVDIQTKEQGIQLPGRRFRANGRLLTANSLQSNDLLVLCTDGLGAYSDGELVARIGQSR